MAKKHIETSKKVLGWVLAFCMAGLVASVVGWFMGLQEAPAMAGIFAGLAGTVIGWYIWKAKAENIMKHNKKHPYKNEPSNGQSDTFGFGYDTNYNDKNTFG